MKIVGACEYALVLYRDKLPKFNNNGKMILNWFDWEVEKNRNKIHPTQKPLPVLEKLIEIFTDEGDTVIDPCAGSGSTLIAARNLKRHSYGFEIKKNFYKDALEWMGGITKKEKEYKQEMKSKGYQTIFDFIDEE